MMKLRKKILLTAGLIGITTPIMAETSYQCLSCPYGTYSVAGSTDATSCKSMGTLSNSMYTKTVSASQGACSTGTILAGKPYRVVLRGGKGGNSTKQGANGGFVEYEFLPNVNYSYELCAGGDGGNSTTSAGGGGGAGSWLKLTYNSSDFYIVAGGGGGGSYKNGNGMKYGGGGGGGIGSGGSAETYTTCTKCGFLCLTCKSSSTQSGGAGGVAGPYGSDGKGLVDGGKVVKEVCIYNDSDNGDTIVDTTHSQRGGGGMYSPLIYNTDDYCSSGLASHDIGYTVSVKLFGDTVYTDIALGGNGGFSIDADSYSADKVYIPASEGKASHKTNVSTLSGKCSGTSGCAVLLSL